MYLKYIVVVVSCVGLPVALSAEAKLPDSSAPALIISYHLLLVVFCCSVAAVEPHVAPPTLPCPLVPPSLNQQLHFLKLTR
jgi:hypothetical protein